MWVIRLYVKGRCLMGEGVAGKRWRMRKKWVREVGFWAGLLGWEMVRKRVDLV